MLKIHKNITIEFKFSWSCQKKGTEIIKIPIFFVGSVGNKDLPTITISNLMPNTKYEARIAIYEDKISLGKSTGIISVTTTNGCEYEGEARGLGQFNVGCDQTCQCYQNGTVSLLIRYFSLFNALP